MDAGKPIPPPKKAWNKVLSDSSTLGTEESFGENTSWTFWWKYQLKNFKSGRIMAGQPTPPNVPPPRNKALLRAY